MPMIEEINIEFTDGAVEQFASFLARITDYEPTLCLYKGRNDDESDDYWGYGVYSPENIETLGPELNKQGHPLLYKISGLVVAISQPDKIAELKGKIIDIGEKSLELIDKNNGI